MNYNESVILYQQSMLLTLELLSCFEYQFSAKMTIKWPISTCNVKSCICCSHLNCKSTIRSTVNGRQFSIVNTTDLD